MKIQHPVILGLIVFCSFLWASEASTAADDELIGRAVAEFSLSNCYGKTVSLSDFTERRAIAIVFLGTECPLAKLYGPKLAAIQNEYADRGVQVIGINPNTQDSLTELAAYSHRHGIQFPMLKDLENVVADAMGATRTPEVFLLDQDHVIRYHGRIDDQYGIGSARERQQESDLTRAIDELLSGRQISVPSTTAIGCHIGRVTTSTPIGTVTYSKHIASILNRHCVSCHRDGEIAPFTLTRYEDVIGWQDTILEVIDNKRMPPWSADPKHGSFANDPSLSSEERELLVTWVENGMPQGDPSELPAAPQYTQGWQMEQPDQVIPMHEVAFQVPAEGIVDYKRFVVDPGWTEDKYIVSAEARPDCRSVVHHILVYVIPESGDKKDIRQIVAGYAPGAQPLLLANGVAIEVKANSKLLFEMHYTPNGSKQQDLSYLGVKFTDKSSVRKLLRGQVATEHDFAIPAGASDHVVEASYQAVADEYLISMTPHMHLRGKSFQYVAHFPDSSSTVLLNVPRYDFNWQFKYVLDAPMRIPPGTKIQCIAVYDNSENNIANPDPSTVVRWGDQSFDEMMIGFMDTIPVIDDFAE